MELISELYRQRYEHRSAFDFETLHFILKSVGFSKIIKQDCGKSLEHFVAKRTGKVAAFYLLGLILKKSI